MTVLMAKSSMNGECAIAMFDYCMQKIWLVSKYPHLWQISPFMAFIVADVSASRGQIPHLWQNQCICCIYIIVNIFKVLTSSIVFGQNSEVLNYPSKVFHNCSGEGVTPWKKSWFVDIYIYILQINIFSCRVLVSSQCILYIIQIYRHMQL